jgi:hypothetical protein
VTEEFVSAVDEVSDHFGSTLDIMESRASPKQCGVRSTSSGEVSGQPQWWANWLVFLQ